MAGYPVPEYGGALHSFRRLVARIVFYIIDRMGMGLPNNMKIMFIHVKMVKYYLIG